MSTVDPAVARERPLEQLQASSPLKTHHLKPESPALDRNPKAVPMAVRYPENDVPAGGTQSAFPSETAGKSLSSSTIIPLKDSPKRNMSPGPLSPTRGLASHFSPSSESPAPLPLLSQASKTPSSDMKAASKPLDSMDSVGEDRSSLGREPSSAPSDAADARPFPNGQKPPPPGALDYTPLNDPVEVYIHPDDARDKVLAAIIKVILRTGNTPATPRELSGLILKGNVALLGGNTPHATVSSRISQHFKRCAEHVPPRKPILGKWSGEGERKLRYYVDQDDPAIPVGEVTDARLQLKIPHTGIDDRLLPELHDTTIVIRPRKSPDDPPGSPLADAPRPKARTVRVPKPKLGDDPVIPRNMTKTRSSSIIMAESDAPSRDFQEDEMVVEKPALVATAKRKRGRPPKSSYEQATPISFEPGVSLGDELLSSDPIAPSDSEVEEDEDPDYGSPGRKRSKAARTAKKKSSSRSRMRLSGGSESFAHYESGYDHAGLGPSSSRRTPSPRRRLGDAAMSQVYPDEVPVNLATALLEELDELPAVADAEVPQTQMVYLAASPPAKQVDVTTAAVWLVELGRVSQPPTPIVMALDSASKEALGAGSRSASSPTLNHAPLVKVEDRRNSLGQMELPSSKLYSLTSPLRQGSEPIPATPPSKFLMDTSTAVTPIAHATSIVVGMDTTKVLKWTYKQEWLDTVKRTEPASSDDLQVEVGAPVPPYKSSQLRQSPLSSRLLSDEHMSDRGSSRSARSSAPGTPGQNLDQIRKPPHFLFDEMDMDHSSQAKDTVGTLDSPTLIRENAAISGIRRQRSRGFNADHGSYGSRGFPSSMGEDDEAEDALIVGTTSSRPSSTYTDIRVGFVSVPDPEPILQSIRRGEEKITRTTSTAVDWRSVLFPESASLPILDQVAQGRQRGQASASGKKAAGGKTSSKPTSPPPRGSASGNEATAGRSLKSHGGGAGGNDGDDEGDGRRRRSPHELPKISAPDDDATDEEEEPEVTTEPLKRESRSPRKATNASPQKERRARSSSRSAATMPTPEPTPGRTPRKNDTSTEVLASVIELKHVEVLPENRLQVVSFYEMDLPGKGASDDSPIRFAKIKVGMLTGILPIRLASSGRLSGEYELNIDLANFVNVAVFFGFPLADMSTISSTVLKCWTAFQAGSWMDSRPMSPKDSKSSRKDSRPIAALEVALLEGTDAADICEENAALFVSGSGLDLQDGEVVDPALIGLWIPMRYAAEIAQRLPQPLPDQLADLITVDDEDLATTTDEDEEERLAASDGDIDLPEANAALLAAMVADSSHDHGSSTGARPVGSKIAQILPPASATLLMDLIAGQQGKGKSKADHPRPSHSKKPVKSDLGNFSPTLRELFADDDAASLFSGDDTMSYFNLSSDGEDGEEDLNLSDLGEISDGAMDELDGGLEEWRRSKEGSPAVEDRTAKLAEAGLPNFAISSLDLQSAAFSLPPPSGPIWKTSIDGVEVYLTLLPRPRSRTTSGSISQPQTPTRGDTGASAVSLMGAQIPIIRRVDDGTVNATTLLLAGGLVSDRERTTVLSLELVKTKTRRKPGLAGTWIPLKRARELSRTYLLEGKLAFFLSDGLSKVFSGAPSPSRQLPASVSPRQSKPPKASTLSEDTLQPEAGEEEQEPTKSRGSSLATNEKLIKKLRRLVDAGGPAALQSDAASDLSAAGNALTTRSGRRRGGRTGLQAVNETFTSIANGTSPNSHNLFLISPTLIPVDFSKQTSHSGSKSAGRKEIAPPSSLLPEPLAVLGVPQVLQDNQHILDHGWESSDDEEQIERRREAIRRRTAAAAAAEATARAVAAERRAQETDSEEDDAFSWFGSDNDNDDEVDPPNRTKQPVGGDTTSEDEGYERDDEKERAQGSDTADEDEDGVTIERTVIVTTSINIPSGAFKGRLPPIGSFAGSPLLSASKPSSPVTRPQTPLRVASPAPELSVGRSGWGAAESSVPLPSMLRKRSSEGPYPDAKRAKPTVRLKVRAPAQPAPVLRPPVDGDETEEDDIE